MILTRESVEKKIIMNSLSEKKKKFHLILKENNNKIQ